MSIDIQTTAPAAKAKVAKRLTMEDLLAKGHSHIVPDSLRYDPVDNKQKVTIQTKGIDGQFDGLTREIATSDLHQCFWTQATKDRMDAIKRNLKAKNKRAAAKATPVPAPVAGETAEARLDALLA